MHQVAFAKPAHDVRNASCLAFSDIVVSGRHLFLLRRWRRPVNAKRKQRA